jgi:hypothetical protein
MDRNNHGQLTSAERKELQALARDAEEIALSNARKLAGQRHSIASLQGEENR